MSFATLWSPGWTDAARPAPELLHALLDGSPHVVAAGDLVWVDGRGLPPRRLARQVLDAARRWNVAGARVGLSAVAIVAEVAARHGTGRPIAAVAPGAERAYLARHPLGVLEAAATTGDAWTPRLTAAFADVGLVTCGDFAALTQEAVEVRFGAGGVACWRLARAEDPRPVFALFAGRSRALPAASLAWTGYELRDVARLVFVAKGLADRVCADLAALGEGARAMTLHFALAGGGAVERCVRGARPTADRVAWLRLVRAELERMRKGDLPDGVVALGLRVDTAAPQDAPQGDVFDAGFQTGAAAEAVVVRLIDAGLGEVVACEATAHPLPECRVRRRVLPFAEVARALRATVRTHTRASDTREKAPNTRPNARPNVAPDVEPLRPKGGPRGTTADDEPTLAPEPLAFRLLPAPRLVVATTRERRGVRVPLTYCERGEKPPIAIVSAAGPDRIVTGHETGEGVAREYWQCATDEGRIVLLYREPGDGEDAWFLQGWWD